MQGSSITAFPVAILAMVGGPDRSVELHPVSIEGNDGLNLAAGVATIDLKFSPTFSPHG